MIKNFKHVLLVLAILITCSSLFAQEADSLVYSPSLKMKALLQTRYESILTDSVSLASKIDPNVVNNNFLIRRAELRADYQFNADIKGVIRVQIPALKSSAPGAFLELAYAEWRITDAFIITAGQFKIPYNLDEMTSHTDLRMVDRGPTSSLLSANSQASYQPGIMIEGAFAADRPLLNYSLSLQNGSNRAVNFDIDDQKNVTARVEYFLFHDLRLSANAQLVGLQNDEVLAYGGDISWLKKLNPKNLLIVEGSYSTGVNSIVFINDTSAFKELDKYQLGGYFGQVLWKTDLHKRWCRTFELGAKYEFTDPLLDVDDNAFSVLTQVIGFTFLPKNAARLQFEISNVMYEQEVPGSTKNFFRFITQLQLQI